jgi:hypothetical protein
LLFHTSPLFDVTAGRATDGLALRYPPLHVALAPFTLVLDWLNGGSRADLKGFVLWAIALYAVARVASRRHGALRETCYAAAWAAGIVAFLLWGAYGPRPIPRLAAQPAEWLIWDAHSHSSASHDGRPGFGVTQNARWHESAGFDAAFLTDHNSYGALRAWRGDSARPSAGPRLLDGEELSLWGLHLIVLGNTAPISNVPGNSSWDSTLALIRSLSGSDSSFRSPLPAPRPTPFLIASLPEYWRHHWGPDLAQLVEAGVRGFEIWTTSPRAMEIPPGDRAFVIHRARSASLALVGGTDMHGIGRTATVWNVMVLPGWREMSDGALQRAVIRELRIGFDRNRVIAVRRWMPSARIGQAVAVPVNLLLLLRQASAGHAVSLLAWVWGAAALAARWRRGS